ncbi:MAG: hypothetical protein NE334_15965 [Lentisphaeraceae bacterium]|nr:hypothetical protein [Lentisphaeraceae bacterium]
MNKTLRNFNLVEIIISMGIIVVCLTTILGLYSAGMKISTDASMNAYANIVIENIVGIHETNPNITTPHNAQPSITNADAANDESNYDALPMSGSTSTINIHKCSENGLYRIEFKSILDESVAAEITDFVLYARMWTEDNANSGITMSDGAQLTYNKTLKVEISWPPHEDYLKRKAQGNTITYTKDL